jgi:hypothetical protein
MLWQTALILLALVPVTALALLGEERVLNGINLWIKPLKFQLSVALHLATLAVLLALVAPAVRGGRLLHATMLTACVAAVFEIAYITGQAARGAHSHFNLATPLEEALYGLMGVGAVILIAAALILAVAIARRPADGIGPGLRLGAVLGLGLGFLATLIVAGTMSAGTGHWVGTPPSDAGGLPIVGWSREGGDLRVPHFFATHLMQVLPAVGWLADRLSRSRSRSGGRNAGSRARTAVLIAAALGVSATGVAFLQALAGQPLIPAG